VVITPRVIEGGGICSVNKGGFNLLRQLWCRWSVQIVREPAGETTDEIELSSGVGVRIVEPFLLHNLTLSSLDQTLQVLLKEAKLSGLVLLRCLHCPEKVPVRLQNPENLSDVVGRDCLSGETAGSDDHVVALLLQSGRPNSLQVAPDVIPVQLEGFQLPQGWHVLVQGIHVDVSLALDTR
jgi:hypothetical protein